MRLMSFSMTEAQILDRSKTVTRRLGWLFAEKGMTVRAVHKCMGLKPGEKPRELAVLRIMSVRRETLGSITKADVVREGYPNLSPREFVRKFQDAMGCGSRTEVTRIHFIYVEAASLGEVKP